MKYKRLDLFDVRCTDHSQTTEGLVIGKVKKLSFYVQSPYLIQNVNWMWVLSYIYYWYFGDDDDDDDDSFIKPW